MAKKLAKQQVDNGDIIPDFPKALFRRLRDVLEDDPDGITLNIEGVARRIKVLPSATFQQREAFVAALICCKAIDATPAGPYGWLERGFWVGLEFDGDDDSAELRRMKEKSSIGGKNSAKIKDSDDMLLRTAYNRCCNGKAPLKDTTAEFNRLIGQNRPKVTQKTVTTHLKKLGILENTTD